MIRKIISKEEQEKHQKRKIAILGIILIFVMLGSIFGMVVSSFGQKTQKNKIKYNEYEFINENGFWKASINNINFAFSYLPSETKEIPAYLKDINNYYNKPLYVLSEDLSAEAEIYRNLQQIASRVQPGCLNAENCTGDFPVKTCSDNFIIIEESSEGEIIQSENCVYIRGEKQELAKTADLFLYKILNIK